MKIDDSDYEFALARKFAEKLNSATDRTETENKQVAAVVAHEAIREVKSRLTWPLIAVGAIFIASNISVLILLGVAMTYDQNAMSFALERKMAYNRLIEPQVILSLVAGVTVQSVVAFTVIVKGYYQATK
ncbi:hypothetical protein [Ideonella paludis]|uniref:Uncharacterized protein n=1 Tax=Ideonella paludis TaxID=1233411 RepID=A0ABS5DZG1_9BURK|nr:hypothetical protein [Ideonella paludis]MBQ0936523.1 hypothetical protein [Ideonella paludis]